MIGAGAIGAVVAGALIDAGHIPTVCVRSSISSLVVESGGAARPLPVILSTDPASLGPADWVLVAVKAQDTAGAAAWLRRLCGPNTVVVALQNGIDHRERLQPYVGPASILPALVHIAAERLAPGRVVHHGGLRVTVPAGVHGASFAHLFTGSALEVAEEPDMVTAVWRKLLANLVANPVTALTMRRADVMNDPGIADLGRALLAEALVVGRAEGARVGQADVDDFFARYRTVGYGKGSGTSTYYDRLAGRPLEHEELTGALVRVARRRGIPTPLNDGILALLRALDRGQARPSG